jgi:hypothetical protein
MAGRLATWSALCALPLLLAPEARADPHTDYMLDCMGCHRADGSGVAGKVPDMRASLAPLSATAAGRRYLVQVPGVAQSPLSSRDLAQLLNWMMHHLSGQPVPKGFEAFTPREVAADRKTPLVDVVGTRQRLLGAAPRGSVSAAGS